MATNGDLNGAKRKRVESTGQAPIDVNSKTTRADFEAVFPGLVKDLTEHVQGYKIPKDALEWFVRVSIRPT